MSRKQWGMGTVYQRGKRWWIAYNIKGKQYQESSRSERRADAVSLLKEKLKQDHKPEPAPPITISALLDLVLYDYRTNGKGIDWAETLVNTHLRPFFGAQNAETLGSEEIRRYVDARRALGRANATINHELALLRRAYTLGQECDPPKVHKRIKIKKLEEDNIRKGFFTQEEFERQRDALPEDFRPLLTFAYWTGCRRGEILGMKWDQVDLKSAMIRLEPGTTKNKKGRSIPLTDKLLSMFLDMKAQRDKLWPDSPWVFSRRGSRIIDFRGVWSAAAEVSGVQRLFHDLRRTGVRNLRRSGVSEKIAMEISGHKTRSVFDRYDIVDEQDIRAAMKKREKFKA